MAKCRDVLQDFCISIIYKYTQLNVQCFHIMYSSNPNNSQFFAMFWGQIDNWEWKKDANEFNTIKILAVFQ